MQTAEAMAQGPATSAQALAGAWVDDVLLVILVVTASLPYLAGLGFYSDDWSFLAKFEHVGDNILPETVATRPGQIAYLRALFDAFGLNPHPYHLLNTLVLAGCGALCRRMLDDLGLHRALAFAVAALFITSPIYSTDRMWLAAFQIPLSLLLLFASVLADLQWARRRRPLCKLLAVSLLIASAAAYEIALPLFALAAIVVGWIASRNARRPGWRPRLAAAWPQLINLAAIALVIAYKRAVTSRLDAFPNAWAQLKYGLHTLLNPAYDWRTDYGLNLKTAFSVDFGDGVLRLPRAAWLAFRDHPDPTAALAAALVGGVVFWRLASLAPIRWTRLQLAALLFGGLVVFAIGYSSFVLTSQTGFSPYGIANRTAMAAALGVAIAAVGALALLATLVGRLGQSAFAIAAGFVCAAGVLVLCGVGHYWGMAYADEQAVLTAIDADVGPLPKNAALILDGVCPYEGPAIVFESNWDLADALTLRNGHKIFADVVTPRLQVTPYGLQTTNYSTVRLYGYGEDLLIYNPQFGPPRPLGSQTEALAYFADPTRRAATPACPRGYQAHGSPIWR